MTLEAYGTHLRNYLGLFRLSPLYPVLVVYSHLGKEVRVIKRRFV